MFTSPPYFNREQYSQDETQSFKLMVNMKIGLDNFLKPTLKQYTNILKKDRYITLEQLILKLVKILIIHLNKILSIS